MAGELSQADFCALAARLAQKAAGWAADTALAIEWKHVRAADPVAPETVERFLGDLQGLLGIARLHTRAQMVGEVRRGP